jgi:hypothetical protein
MVSTGTLVYPGENMGVFGSKCFRPLQKLNHNIGLEKTGEKSPENCDQNIDPNVVCIFTVHGFLRRTVQT